MARASFTRDGRRQVRRLPLRGARCRRPAAAGARLRIDLRRVGDDRRGAAPAPHLPRVAAFSCTREAGPGAGSDLPARCATGLPTGVGDETRHDGHVRRPVADCAAGADRDRAAWRGRGQGRPAVAGRRLHGRRMRGEVPRRRQARVGGAVRGATVCSPPPGLQRVGTLPARRGIRRVTPVHGHPSRFPCRRHLRRLRQRTLPAHVREPRAARDRLAGAVRSAGDPRQQRHVRGRRHLRAVLDAGCGQLVGRLPVRARVRPPLRGARGRVLHLARRLRGADHDRRAVGAERHRDSRQGQAQVASSRRDEHAGPDAVAKGGLRNLPARRAGAPQADSRGAPAGKRDGRALPRGAGARHETARPRALPSGRRRFPGRQLRRAGLLPSAARLHHVHPRRGALLPRMRVGARADDRLDRTGKAQP